MFVIQIQVLFLPVNHFRQGLIIEEPEISITLVVFENISVEIAIDILVGFKKTSTFVQEPLDTIYVIQNYNSYL